MNSSFVVIRSAGMQAMFEIKKCFPNVHKARPHGDLRSYFIAAEEEVWDYAPIPPTDGLVTLQTHTHTHTEKIHRGCTLFLL